MGSRIEQEIRDCYERMDHALATREGFGSPAWSANSAYGYTLSLHDTREVAERAVIDYYRKRMHLIRQ